MVIGTNGPGGIYKRMWVFKEHANCTLAKAIGTLPLFCTLRSITAGAAICLSLISSNLLAVTEYQIKAALLYKFSKFVEWPKTAFRDKRTPFGICVIGHDPFGSTLDAISDRRMHERRTIVRRLESGALRQQSCHTLFIPTSERSRLQSILLSIDNLPILTISDFDTFAERGGIIELKKTNQRIRFEVNIDAAHDAGLQISAQLLRLATVVYNKEGH